MVISTRGRYALHALIDLIEHAKDGKYIPLKDVARRQGISQKYLEGIMARLSKVGLVRGAHGKGGGYTLTRDPGTYTVYEILKNTEVSFATVASKQKKGNLPEHAVANRIASLWVGLDQTIEDYLSKITLESLAHRTE